MTDPCTPLALMITGHRPNKLGGYQPCALHEIVQAALVRLLTGLKAQGFTVTGISGMALGVDQLFVNACLLTATPFRAFVPFDGQDARWPSSSRKRYQDLLSYTDDVVICGPRPTTYADAAKALHARNGQMVDACDAAIAVWNGSPGGTADAVGRLIRARKPWLQVDPANPNVTPLAFNCWLTTLRQPRGPFATSETIAV